LGGSGSGEGQGSGGKTPNITDPAKEKQPKVEPKEPESVRTTLLRVRVEKAADYPRTFRFGNDAEAIDLEAAKMRLVDVAKSANAEQRLELELRIYQDSTSAEHQVIVELIKFAHSKRFSTRMDIIKDRLP
jgi:hypothetical protein